jgi:preprotein translocase subunit YajC
MGAIAIFILVIVITVVGVIYFTIQDRKQTKHVKEQL